MSRFQAKRPGAASSPRASRAPASTPFGPSSKQIAGRAWRTSVSDRTTSEDENAPVHVHHRFQDVGFTSPQRPSPTAGSLPLLRTPATVHRSPDAEGPSAKPLPQNKTASDITVETEMKGGGERVATKEIYTFDDVALAVYGYAGEYSKKLQAANPEIDPRRVFPGKTKFKLPELMVVKQITFPKARFDAKKPLSVPYGQQTFDAEGQEGGPYHSRKPTVPGDESGVTIGRGYDMKQREAPDIRKQLVAAGIPDSVATAYKQAAGKYGKGARDWLKEQKKDNANVGTISKEQQWELFIQEYQRKTHRVVSYLLRLELAKQKDGSWKSRLDFENLDAKILELLIDMDYRGNLRAEWKGDFRKHVIANDSKKVATFVRDHVSWRKNDYQRYQARCKIMGVTPKPKESDE